MLRELGYLGEFALVGGGAVATSLAAALSRVPGALGPVVAVSYRVASRISNALEAGWPAPGPEVLRDSPLILVNAPMQQMKALAQMLGRAQLDWTKKSVVFVDCEPGSMRCDPLKTASFAWIGRCPMPGRLAVSGDATALTAAIRLAQGIDRHPIVVPGDVKQRFEAAMLLGGAALTPIIDSVAHILRETGMLDKQAARTAVALFQSSVLSYARSGRQSWEWHVHQPDVDGVETQIGALGATEGAILRSLLLLGFDRFQRHPTAAGKLRDHSGRR